MVLSKTWNTTESQIIAYIYASGPVIVRHLLGFKIFDRNMVCFLKSKLGASFRVHELALNF